MTNDNYTSEDWFELGKYHSNIKNKRNAIECYAKAINLNPNFYKAWNNMAAEYFQIKNYVKSIKCCKRAIQIDKKKVNPWLNLAANYFQINDDGRAIFCFYKAKELGSLKAEQFLKKAENLNDKLLQAKKINVLDEIMIENESLSVLSKEISAEQMDMIKENILKRKHVTLPPSKYQKDYLKKLCEFLLEFGNNLLIKTGGVISILELYSVIKSDFPRFNGNPKDIVKALKILEDKDLIEGLRELENSNIKIVEFLPSEFTSDFKDIIELASTREFLTYEDIVKELDWEEYRIERIMNLLEKKKIARKSESYREGIRWYFPIVE